MRIAPPLAALVASLSFAAPAFAQAPAQPTVGQPQVITDPASQVNPPAAQQPAPQQPSQPQTQQPSVHQIQDDSRNFPPVLHVTGPRGSRDESAATATSAVQAVPAPAPEPAPAAPASASASASPPAATSRQLPFTGVATWQIALIGLALLGAGAGLWRYAEQRP